MPHKTTTNTTSYSDDKVTKNTKEKRDCNKWFFFDVCGIHLFILK